MTATAYVGAELLLDGRFERGDLVVEDGMITSIAPPSGPLGGPLGTGAKGPAPGHRIDLAGRRIAAGFIDLQCNGANGVDLTTDPDRILDVAGELPRFGVTAFLPTVVTSPASTRLAALESLRRARRAAGTVAPGGPRPAAPLGLHFEGPMISRDRLGAHDARFVDLPDSLADEVDTWIESGAVSLVTLAPELPGAVGLVAHLAANGIVVSGGHTAMTPADLGAARAVGLSYATHLYNAMAPFGHRAPGAVGAVLGDDALVAGLICDGIHVDPIAVKIAWRSLGPDRLSLVSDASAALGAPYGHFDLGGFEVIHDETGVRTLDGVLAGSALALDAAVRNLVAFSGCTLAEALGTVTSVPADVLGLADRGRLEVGARADFVVLDDDGRLDETIIAGVTAWTRH